MPCEAHGRVLLLLAVRSVRKCFSQLAEPVAVWQNGTGQQEQAVVNPNANFGS